MAIPFMGKDVPSRHAEYAHPEVLIGLTILSYRYEGLRPKDMEVVVTRLKQAMMQQPGNYFQRPARVLYQDWITKYELRAHKAGSAAKKLLPLELYPLGNQEQLRLAMEALAKLPEVVTYYLKIAFEKVLKYKPSKLQARSKQFTHNTHAHTPTHI